MFEQVGIGKNVEELDDNLGRTGNGYMEYARPLKQFYAMRFRAGLVIDEVQAIFAACRDYAGLEWSDFVGQVPSEAPESQKPHLESLSL